MLIDRCSVLGLRLSLLGLEPRRSGGGDRAELTGLVSEGIHNLEPVPSVQRDPSSVRRHWPRLGRLSVEKRKPDLRVVEEGGAVALWSLGGRNFVREADSRLRVQPRCRSKNIGLGDPEAFLPGFRGNPASARISEKLGPPFRCDRSARSRQRLGGPRLSAAGPRAVRGSPEHHRRRPRRTTGAVRPRTCCVDGRRRGGTCCRTGA